MSGKSGSQWAGAIVGGVAGFILSGGNPLGAAVGLSLGAGLAGLIDPPKGPVVDGPRINDLSQQTSTFGAGIGRSHGKMAIMGNVIWLENNQIKETIRKKRQGGKGGGGGTTVKTYSYSATFAVALTDTPPEGIAGYTRVWIGSDLIYNVDSTDLETVVASNKASSQGWWFADVFKSVAGPGRISFKVYNGADDQQPDPRMEADLGVGNCPAFRGTSYIVFYDLPLEKYSNSLVGAQVKVEVVTNNATTTTLASLGSDSVGETTPYYVDQVIPICNYMTATETIINVANWNIASPPSNSPFLQYIANTRNIRFVGSVVVAQSAASYNPTLGISDDETIVQPARPGAMPSTNISESFYVYKNEITYWLNISENKLYSNASGGFLSITITDPAAFDVGDDGLIYVLTSAGISVYDEDLVSVDDYAYVFTGEPYGSTIQTARLVWYADGIAVAFFRDTGTADDDNIYFFNSDFTDADGPYLMPHAAGTDAASDAKSLNIDSGIILRVTPKQDGSVFIDRFKLPYAGSASPTLASVVESELLRTGMIREADIDVTSLASDYVRGYRISGVKQVRSCLEPLMGAYPFDLIQSGYQIKAVRRGTASVITVDEDHLDAREFGSSFGVLVESETEMDTQLPRQIYIEHLDPSREYDANAQPSHERISTQSVDIRSIELPLALTPTEAAQMADVLHTIAWIEKSGVSFKLPPTYLQVEAADVLTISVGGGTVDVIAKEVNYQSDGTIEISGKFYSAPAYTSPAVGGSGSVSNDNIELAADAELVLMDIPLVRNDENSPGFVAAMAGTTDNWTGGVLYKSMDAEQSWIDTQAWSAPAVIGVCRTSLPAHDGLVIDRSSTLRVDMISGELDSVTEAQMMTGLNWAAYGADQRWELIRFADADLQPDGSYILSTLLRGLRGTEQFTGNHVDGDSFVLLDDADALFIGSDLASLSYNRYWRAVTVDQSIDDVTSQEFAYRGVNLKPLSAVHGLAALATNDWVFTWDKRTRLQGSLWKTGVALPLGEASESWQIDIMDGATVVRTLTATTETVTYTSAQQVADWGSNQTSIAANVYQISADVGRGYPLEISA